MKVLDATFLIDYLNGVEAAAAYLLAHEDETFVIPAPAYAEVLVGAVNGPGGDVAAVAAGLSWADIHPIDADTAVRAGEIAAEIGPQGPYLTGMDGLIAAVGRELDAPVVSADRDLTHEATRRVVAVETYRE